VLNARAALGTHDVLFITLDTLRFDVADRLARAGELETLGPLLPGGTWERRHSPGNFTYAAHHAFFAGFLPTPVTPGPHPRLFALEFPGSTTTAPNTCVFDAPDIVSGFAAAGYHTLCVGGVGFFNKLTPLGRVLPGLFAESHWSEALGVTDPDSTRNQVRLIEDRVAGLDDEQRLFLFLNVSALHQPNRFYVEGAEEDSLESHGAALRYVDRQLAPLFALLRRRAPVLVVICSDHGTAYGEDGFAGHRLNHPTVLDVPYAELILERADVR
jgi:hypothetical protein